MESLPPESQSQKIQELSLNQSDSRESRKSEKKGILGKLKGSFSFKSSK
jgi:hypothetical protein